MPTSRSIKQPVIDNGQMNPSLTVHAGSPNVPSVSNLSDEELRSSLKADAWEANRQYIVASRATPQSPDSETLVGYVGGVSANLRDLQSDIVHGAPILERYVVTPWTGIVVLLIMLTRFRIWYAQWNRKRKNKTLWRRLRARLGNAR